MFSDIDYICLVPIIALLFSLIALIIAVIDVTLNKGIEIVHFHLPQWDTVALHHFLVSFFMSRGYHCYPFANRIYSYRGEKWLMGVRTFDIVLARADPGSVLTGYFYLRGIWPVRMIKFTRFGYMALLPRRQGWRLKNELYYYLGVNQDGT